MVHVHVDPDKQKARLAFGRDLVFPHLAPGYFHIDNFGRVFPTSSCAPQTKSISCSKEATESEETQMHSWLEPIDCRPMGLDDITNKISMTHEAMSDDFGYWSEALTSTGFEESKAQFYDYRVQSSSQTQGPFTQSIREISLPEGYGQHEQFAAHTVKHEREGKTVADDVIFGMAHPTPRLPSLCMTGSSSFTSFSGPETESVSTPDNSREYRFNGDKFPNQEWAINELEASQLLQTSLEGRSVPVVNNFIPVSDPVTPPPWPAFRIRAPWDVQHQNTNRDDALWVDTPCGLSINGLYDHVDGSFDHAPSVRNDHHSVSLQETAYQYYTQPAISLCQNRFEHVGFALGKGQYADDPACNSNLTTDESSFSRESLGSRQIACHSDGRDAFLVECKRQGLSYKDIKRIGGFKEAESTLRGRFRTLTKSKEQRVRKPQWQEKDISLLCEAVNVCMEDDKQSRSAYTSSCRPTVQPPKVSWKRVAQYIWAHGGSYHFGNATCKKKWCDIHGLEIWH
ncbi:hypothetical protein BDV28DRAFT_160540 [Aspergillus coremiiformis]|uniref:Myb-like domain-containing protein n=1 Tax=Aspergillus coremiiformis TaxID=138285 RepID=A0A5N6YXJ8_9EURO|nr:hypothetical protein BDV28DRAFT_160540 [Aspergillus coremiiformis]